MKEPNHGPVYYYINLEPSHNNGLDFANLQCSFALCRLQDIRWGEISNLARFQCPPVQGEILLMCLPMLQKKVKWGLNDTIRINTDKKEVAMILLNSFTPSDMNFQIIMTSKVIFAKFVIKKLVPQNHSYQSILQSRIESMFQFLMQQRNDISFCLLY